MGNFSFSKYFGDINMLADLQFMPGEKPYIDRPSAAFEPKDLLLYLGCNVLRTAHLAKTVIGVLRAMGFDFNSAGGLTAAESCTTNTTIQKGARNVAANSMRHFAKYGAKQVLMWCPSCNEHYDEVVAKEQEVAFPYEHVTSFIARHLDRIRFVKAIEKRVAVHYHTGFPQADSDCQNALTILGAIPGIELIAVPHSPELGRHCSPKWINRMGQPQWRQAIVEGLDSAVEARVDILATIYHSCHREICEEEGKYPLQIINYISLLGEAMGLEDPDMYKRYKRLADPDAVFGEVEDYVTAHGLAPERVREILGRMFAPRCEVDPANPS